MTAAAYSLTGRGLAPVFNERLATVWRNNARNIEEHIFFCNQYWKRISEEGERLPSGRLVHKPTDILSARNLLKYRLERYREDIRYRSEAEATMDLIGMEYARSSDDWRTAP